jgi:hypothetical protein
MAAALGGVAAEAMQPAVAWMAVAEEQRLGVKKFRYSVASKGLQDEMMSNFLGDNVPCAHRDTIRQMDPFPLLRSWGLCLHFLRD